MKSIIVPIDGKQNILVHWHLILVHFPISFYLTAFLFQVLHVFIASFDFEMATNVVLSAATVTMIPTVWSGWLSWKIKYTGVKGRLFRRKIAIGFIMLGLSMSLILWRIAFYGLFTRHSTDFSHWIFLAGILALMAGAAVEGLYGSSLNHKEGIFRNFAIRTVAR